MALLDLTDITVRFGGVTAVSGATLSAEAGTVTGLIGPNGAGKTTLFNVVTGLQPPSSGQVRFKGRDVTKASVDRRAKMGLARTFQRLEAFGSLTVRENIQVARDIHHGPRAWFAGHRDSRVDQLIEVIGLGRYADQRADAIPTGTARLLELARALAIEPELLLLDEPSSGLDEAESDELAALLRRIVAVGRAVLMVEHDMDLVMGSCDRIHVLEHGEVIASGTPAQIRTDARVQSAYLGSGAGSTHLGGPELVTAAVADAPTTVIPAARHAADEPTRPLPIPKDLR